MIKNFIWHHAKIGFLFSLILILAISCKKENLPPKANLNPADDIQGKTVRYTVMVVAGGFTSFKSTNAIDSTIVSIVMNDSVYNTVADVNGIATFNNLAAGVTAVNVRRANYTSARFIVDLTARADSVYDSENIRNAATMVVLFPLSGLGTASISGHTFADLDLTIAGNESAPAGLQISAIIEHSQLINYVNHSGDGEILSLSYEPSITSNTTNIFSDYTLTVPATGSGLKIVVTGNDFQYNMVTVIGTLQRKIYRSVSDTIVAISGMSYYTDLEYE